LTQQKDRLKAAFCLSVIRQLAKAGQNKTITVINRFLFVLVFLLSS